MDNHYFVTYNKTNPDEKPWSNYDHFVVQARFQGFDSTESVLKYIIKNRLANCSFLFHKINQFVPALSKSSNADAMVNQILESLYCGPKDEPGFTISKIDKQTFDSDIAQRLNIESNCTTFCL